MTRIRTLFALCVLALAIGAAVAGCGGSDSSSEDPQTVLDETFNNDTKVTSGDLSLTASVKAEGDQGGSFEASLSGPFQGDASDSNAIPQLDWTASLTGSGAGQSIDFAGGVTVTSDNAYVTYKDQAYEVGTDQFAQLRDAFQAQQAAGATGASGSTQGTFQEQCSAAIQQAGGDPSACNFDLSGWIDNLSNDGTEDVGGTSTIHISGDANVQQILTDIGNLASSIPGASAQGIDPSQLGALSGAVTDASIDVFTGADDHVLRKVDANLTIDPSVLVPGGAVGPITISFAVEIDGLNDQQTIEAPSGAKPISQLFSDVGIDPSSLGGLPGLGSGGSGSGAGDAYLQCVQQAQSAAEINNCASQL
ncbi:MAG: hypothetical protein QOI10_3029 [Solirubrobacterales bacterium]|nr:hypothetical protein [Solirubrobacterales bacterium]